MNKNAARTTGLGLLVGTLGFAGCGEAPAPAVAEPVKAVAAPNPAKGKTRTFARPTDHPLARMDPEERREYFRKRNEEAAAKKAATP